MKAIFREGLTLAQIRAAEYKDLSHVCAIPKHLISGGQRGERQRVVRRLNSKEATEKEINLLRAYYREHYSRKWIFHKLIAW